MKIARVFPRKTKWTPIGADVYFQDPDWFTPDYDEIHVSVVFTWDLARAKKLADAWTCKGSVKMGGPAISNYPGEFEPGFYIKPGVTFTHRGCPNKCSRCLVPEKEGGIRELEIKPGNILHDNNILACSQAHKVKVWDMLRAQKDVQLSGGLECSRITPEIVDVLRSIDIEQLFVACDSRAALSVFHTAMQKLTGGGFNRHTIRCYAIVGQDQAEEEDRLRQIYDAGAMPYAQLLQPKLDQKIEYSKDWREFQKTWCRPAATFAHMKSIKK